MSKLADGSWLRSEDVAARPALNFLNSQRTSDYVLQRIPIVKDANGAIEEDRLRRSLLSSMPLCFNVFGYLRNEPDAAALLGQAFDLDIAEIESMECEDSPDRGQHLNDRTAFDAFVVYRTSSGDRCFVGVETKYTDSFSPTSYARPIYDELTERSGLFKAGAADGLRGGKTNQLWRMALLAASIIDKDDDFKTGHIRFLMTGDDPGTSNVEMLQEHLTDTEFGRVATLDDLVLKAAAFQQLERWASDFRLRYLDVSPVEQYVDRKRREAVRARG